MTKRERAAYLTGLDYGFKMMARFLENPYSVDEIKEFSGRGLLRFFKVMGLAETDEAEEKEFAQMVEEVAEILGSPLCPPHERN